MAFSVRIFGHEGLEQMRLAMPRQHTEDSVFQLTQPYKFSQVISVSAVAASSAPNTTEDRVTILRVEVPDGQAVRYEINPPGRNVAASTNSPILSGHDQFVFMPGWSISLIDAAGLP